MEFVALDCLEGDIVSSSSIQSNNEGVDFPPEDVKFTHPHSTKKETKRFLHSSLLPHSHEEMSDLTVRGEKRSIPRLPKLSLILDEDDTLGLTCPSRSCIAHQIPRDCSARDQNKKKRHETDERSAGRSSDGLIICEDISLSTTIDAPLGNEFSTAISSPCAMERRYEEGISPKLFTGQDMKTRMRTAWATFAPVREATGQLADQQLRSHLFFQCFVTVETWADTDVRDVSRKRIVPNSLGAANIFPRGTEGVPPQPKIDMAGLKRRTKDAERNSANVCLFTMEYRPGRSFADSFTKCMQDAAMQTLPVRKNFAFRTAETRSKYNSVRVARIRMDLKSERV
ncbi:hypothetical protein RB195_018997 [Necator americanus]|uniref:Uncharacterized protein n=1 Tax=Necator americanus TaxID=51031 RepID=A0ABR1CC43_NECAM